MEDEREFLTFEILMQPKWEPSDLFIRDSRFQIPDQNIKYGQAVNLCLD